ncbi:hypothetical protein BD560DRAFT_428175 [Blakeslea trispora]|nr:hypothetical protein BD560DRAFT_428175 [Blakeslea trispora]
MRNQHQTFMREFEISSIKIKPADVFKDVEAIQLNKNIGISKSILHTILLYLGATNNGYYALGMDVVGLTAYVHIVFQYKDIVAAVKAEEDNIHFPVNVDDLEEFVIVNTLKFFFFLTRSQI